MATINTTNLSKSTCKKCNHEYTRGKGYISGWEEKTWKSKCPMCETWNETELVLARTETTVLAGDVARLAPPKAEEKGGELVRARLAKWDSVPADFKEKVETVNSAFEAYKMEQRLKQANEHNISLEALDAYHNDWDTVCKFLHLSDFLNYLKQDNPEDLSQAVLDYFQRKNNGSN